MLAAVFNSAWGRSIVGGQLVGSAQQHFTVGSAKALRVRLPSRAAQDQIAAVLCALNDLIENNRRRVEVMVAMERVVYREWFVPFRPLVRKGTDFADASPGPLPPSRAG